MPSSPVVSVVLGSYNRLPFLKKTLASVRRDAAGLEYEMIVVDGGSTDGSLRWLTEQKDVITIVQHNRGRWQGRSIERRSWGYFMNLGFRSAQGKYILMISDDCLLVPGALPNGLKHFDEQLQAGRPVAAVAFYWRDWPIHDLYRVGLTLGDKMFVNHGLYLRDKLAEVGWCDEDHYRFYHADGDVCLKLWQSGYEVADCPEAYVEHFSHANRAVRHSNLVLQQQDWQTYLQRWTGIFYDPERDNYGRWLERAYSDPHNTVSEFPRWEVARFLWRDRIRRYGRRLKRLLNPMTPRALSGR